MVALLFITPLYCTSLAFGFYFRVVVTIRARALWLSRFWLRLDRLIKPCFLPASPLLSLYIALAFTHAVSRSLRFPIPLLAFHITCMLSRTHAHHRRTPSRALLTLAHASCAPLTAHFSSHTSRLSISLCASPVYLSHLSILVLCVVAVPFRVEHVCLRHSSLGAVRPDILPHQQCC
jgi:hypothetical protein